MLELIWGEVEVICVLLYVNYPEKKTELNEKMFQVAHKSEMQWIWIWFKHKLSPEIRSTVTVKLF